MKIERICRLQDCGIFRDFTWSNALLDFGRFNVIYGWNGTGKTTLSRLFRALGECKNPAGKVTIRINGGNCRWDIHGKEFPQQTLQVRVFNRDFINKVIFSVERKDLPPIFIFGKESVERQKEVEQLKNELTAKEGELNVARLSKEQAEKEFDKHCVNRATVIRESLRSSGKNQYNNYDKRDYKKDADDMAKSNNASTARLSDEERQNLLNQLGATPKPKLRELSYRVPSLDELAHNALELLRSKVITTTIESLKRIRSYLSGYVKDSIYTRNVR